MTVVGVVVIGPWPNDTADPFREPYGQKASANWLELGRKLKDATEENISVGWASVPMVIPAGTPLGGYADRDGAEGRAVGESLSFRAVALAGGGRAVVVVGADLLLVNDLLATAVRSRLRNSPAPAGLELLFTATHTHSGPGGWGKRMLEEVVVGDFSQAVVEALSEACVEAVLTALADLRPGAVGWVSARLPSGVRNRTVPGGETDPIAEALVIENASGRAVVAFYGAHATCLTAENRIYHRDYPGYLVDALEASPDVEFALFAAGAVGSQAPAGRATSGKALASELGESVAGVLLPLIRSADLKTEVAFASGSVRFPTPPIHLRVSGGTRLSGWLGEAVHRRETWVSALRLGEDLLLALPVEVSGMLTTRMRDGARTAGWNLRVSCFNGDYLGYVVPDELYPDTGLYETRMNFLGPHGGAFVTKLVETLTDP